jgi:AraC family ethanolamine operon transcriptional activator
MPEDIASIHRADPSTRRAPNPEALASDDGYSWLDLATSDAQEPASILRQWMDIEYDQIDGGTFDGRFHQLGFQGTLLATERQNRTVLKRVYFPPEYCTVSMLRSVSGEGRCGFDTLPGRSVGYMPGNKEYEVLLPPSEIVFFRIRQERFLSAAETLGYALPKNGHEMLFLEGLNSSYLDEMAETLMSIQNSPDSALFASLDHRYLDDVVLERVVGVMLDASTRSSRWPSPGARRIVKAAQECMEGPGGEPMTVMTLCRRLNVSRASLQRSFLQIYGISPLAYLRVRRLNSARRELRAAQGTNATVTAIAMRWGFFHLARFSQDYFQQFGELPSATLGRAARSKTIIRET